MNDQLPTGPFDVIVCDPPWNDDFGSTCSRSTTRHYPVLSIDKLKTIAIPAAPNSLMFMWVTAPMLVQGLALLHHWGFSYRTCMVWDKCKIGTGWWVRNQHELVLIGRRGRFPAPRLGTAESSVIREPRTTHSTKPEALQDMIERVFPHMRYLEMFARRERNNWNVWGNEIG